MNTSRGAVAGRICSDLQSSIRDMQEFYGINNATAHRRWTGVPLGLVDTAHYASVMPPS